MIAIITGAFLLILLFCILIACRMTKKEREIYDNELNEPLGCPYNFIKKGLDEMELRDKLKKIIK